MSDWHPCTCNHLGVAHATDGPCSECDCPAFVELAS